MQATAEVSDERDAPQFDRELSAQLERLAARLNAKADADTFEEVDAQAARKLFAALLKVYALRTEAGERDLPLDLGDSGTNATDLMITASALLKAGDLEVFELGMWQSYTRFV